MTVKQKLQKLDQETLIFIIIGIAIGASSTYIISNTGQVSGQEASQNIISALEAQTSQQFQLQEYESKNGIYKTTLATEEDGEVTYYITKDGDMFSSHMSETDEVIQTVDRLANFSECLEQENIVMYGSLAQETTLIQIQILGGKAVIEDIYQELDDETTIQEALQKGVERVPALYKNGQTLEGVNTIEQVSDFTNCEIQL